jgi:hypothetical protein
MKALHLMVDTGNPNAIDFSLKEFGLEIVIDGTYAEAKHRKMRNLSAPHFASVCAFAIEADWKRKAVSDR